MWRNDVKDFMNGKIPSYKFEELEVSFAIKDTDNAVIGHLSRPDLIFGITFICVPKKDSHLEGKQAIHPITQQETPIFVADIEEPHFGIPAHNDDDYEFAIHHHVPIKQVVMPVNASLDENKPREDKEWSYKQNVVLVVKHWNEDKYLYIEYKNQRWKCFISGGIEENETPKDAAIRELKEESGYYNIKTIEEMPFQMANVFYAAHKGINRYSTVTSFYIELENGDCLGLDEKELAEHEVKWSTKEELFKILKNGFTDQIWLLKQHLGDIRAYTGMGKMINSDFLNNLEDSSLSVLKVEEYFQKG